MEWLFKARHRTTRVRRDSPRRLLTVTDVERITPRMQRMSFHSLALGNFEALAPDDHIKLFIPISEPDNNGVDSVCARNYTPRTFDAASATLNIDFALHEHGPATSWALRTRPGDKLEIGGPRKSNVVADDFDWYLLIGDETALPAIGRRVEELRSGVPVTTVVVVETIQERQSFATSAVWTPIWISRQGQGLGDDALIHLVLADYVLPPGDGYIWIAAEAGAARSIRTFVSETWDHPKEWTKSSGYWVRGRAGAHE